MTLRREPTGHGSHPLIISPNGYALRGAGEGMETRPPCRARGRRSRSQVGTPSHRRTAQAGSVLPPRTPHEERGEAAGDHSGTHRPRRAGGNAHAGSMASRDPGHAPAGGNSRSASGWIRQRGNRRTPCTRGRSRTPTQRHTRCRGYAQGRRPTTCEGSDHTQLAPIHTRGLIGSGQAAPVPGHHRHGRQRKKQHGHHPSRREKERNAHSESDPGRKERRREDQAGAPLDHRMSHRPPHNDRREVEAPPANRTGHGQGSRHGRSRKSLLSRRKEVWEPCRWKSQRRRQPPQTAEEGRRVHGQRLAVGRPVPEHARRPRQAGRHGRDQRPSHGQRRRRHRRHGRHDRHHGHALGHPGHPHHQDESRRGRQRKRCGREPACSRP
jgi:hypothetical protein